MDEIKTKLDKILFIRLFVERAKRRKILMFGKNALLLQKWKLLVPQVVRKCCEYILAAAFGAICNFEMEKLQKTMNLFCQSSTVCSRDRGLYKRVKTQTHAEKHKCTTTNELGLYIFGELSLKWFRQKGKKLVDQFLCLWRSRCLAHTVFQG